MGIQYLWIDSLCILQDVENDSRKKTSNMSSIYRGLFLIIAALRAHNGGDG
jgi:hypothetical protein